jgi:hypothetical protein
MNKFKKACEGIDFAIAQGISSVEMLEAVRSAETNKDAVKGYLVSHIVKHHMDEELELFLQDTMGYDPMLHRMQVAHDGTMTF